MQQSFELIEATLKRAAAALRRAEVSFLLGGSLASWARGGPESQHDLDLMIRPDDVERALAALEEAGMRREVPPEAWLVKAWDGDVLVDLIFHPKGMEVDDAMLARGEELSVLGLDLRVMSLEDVLVTKLLSITEHDLRFDTPLAIARACREQVDWADVRARTAGSPFSRAFFVMLEDLDVLPAAEPAGEPTPSGATVRVLTPRSGAHGAG